MTVTLPADDGVPPVRNSNRDRAVVAQLAEKLGDPDIPVSPAGTRHKTEVQGQLRIGDDGFPADRPSALTVGDVFQALRRTMALSSQDWSSASDFATLWGILFGWDDLEEFADRFGWSPVKVADMQRMHALVESLRAV